VNTTSVYEEYGKPFDEAALANYRFVLAFDGARPAHERLSEAEREAIEGKVRDLEARIRRGSA
jgi:hypothetical protein